MGKILIIEDNRDLRENTTEILELANYEVISAENGKEGVRVAINEMPDVIICDIMMPELDGYGVKHMLSNNAITKNIPFIFLTAKADKSDFRKGMNLGADDYLTKPFEEIDLLNSIQFRINKLVATDHSQNALGVSLSTLIQQLIQDKKIIRFSKKETIYRESDTAYFLYYIVSGTLKSFRINEDGKEFIFEIFKKGDSIGLWDVLKGEEYFESAASIEDVEVIKIHHEELHKHLNNNHPAMLNLVTLMIGEMKSREDRLLQLAYDSVRMRVASALTVLNSVYRAKEEDAQFKISREDLAAMVGTSAESVIRTLSDFKKEGYITIMNNEITIIDSDGLRGFKY